MIKGRIYGGKCTELSMRYDLKLSAWKMCQRSLLEEEPILSPRLPRSGMMLNGQLFQQDNLEPRTKGKDGLQLPTPTVQEVRQYPSMESSWKRIKKMGTCTAVRAFQHYGITKDQAIGMGLTLNPQFVEWMMGYPQDWTKID